jgi:hypothetical protein
MTLLITWLFILLVVFAFFCVYLYNLVFRGYAPFVESKPEVVEKIINELKLDQNYKGKIYELGCGKAEFLHTIEKVCPQAELVGIEYSLPLFLLSGIQCALRHSRIKIIKKNLFHANIGEADIIYCYLNQPMMDQLSKKLKFECKPLSHVISYIYPLPRTATVKEIDLEAPQKEVARLKKLEEKKKEEEMKKRGKKYVPKKEKRRKGPEDKLYFYEF